MWFEGFVKEEIESDCKYMTPKDLIFDVKLICDQAKILRRLEGPQDRYFHYMGGV